MYIFSEQMLQRKHQTVQGFSLCPAWCFMCQPVAVVLHLFFLLADLLFLLTHCQVSSGSSYKDRRESTKDDTQNHCKGKTANAGST